MRKLVIVQDRLRHGGTESHSVWLAGALRRSGADATLLTFRPGGPLASRARAAGVRLRALQPCDSGLDWWAPGLAATVEAESPAAVLLMGKLANACAPLLRDALPGVRLVGSVRTGHVLPWWVRRALPVCDAVVSNSRSIAATLPPRGVDAARLTVIPNPPVVTVSPPDPGARRALRARHGAAESDTVLLCVAGFRPGKGQAALVRALALTPGEPGLRLWLAGDGETRAECEALARELGVAERVVFLGHTASPGPLYRAADVAVMASDAEALPNFLVEAQLHGLPVAAWDVGGVKETFLPGESGWLPPAGNLAALAAVWREGAADPARRDRFGCRAAAWAPTVFSEAAAISAYRRVFGWC